MLGYLSSISLISRWEHIKNCLAFFTGSRLRVSCGSSHSVCFGHSSNGSMLVETDADSLSFLLLGWKHGKTRACFYLNCYDSLFSFMHQKNETFVNCYWLEYLIILQILLWFQHDLCWNRNDLFTSYQFIIAFWSCSFMGHYVATDQSSKRKLVPWKFTRK